jgi:hypothetical protein
MIKKIGISIGLLLLGTAISVFTESSLRNLIQALFKSLTNNAIHFYGKEFHLFASPYYYLSFGVVLIVMWFSSDGLSARQKLMDALLTIILFFVAVIAISWVNSNLMIVECTACDDGTRGIHYNDINYDGIIAGSLLSSLIPSCRRFFRRRSSQHTAQAISHGGTVDI